MMEYILGGIIGLIITGLIWCRDVVDVIKLATALWFIWDVAKTAWGW